MDIHVKKSSLKSMSDEVSECSGEIKAILKELENCTTNLAKIWKADSSLQFQQKIFTDYHQNLVNFCDCLEQYSLYLKNASILYQKLEDTYSKKEIEV